MATDQKLRTDEGYGFLEDSWSYALKKGRVLVDRMLDLYETPKLSTTEESPGSSNAPLMKI